MTKQLAPTPEESPFWCGRIMKDGSTRFVKQLLGIGQMRAVPRFLAEKLGYDQSVILEFKGHSMRKTANTILAENKKNELNNDYFYETEDNESNQDQNTVVDPLANVWIES